MCGICGFAGDLHFDKESTLNTMNQSIFHRGPDEAGCFIDDSVGLAMRRLSILDLEHGSQPVFSTDKTIVTVFNGEIYNYQELRQDLEDKGYEFYSHVDTEVIVYLYQEYGERCVDMLRGMFAIAIWDDKNKALLLARDHIGIKPLYYSFNNGLLLFGSEIKAITASSLLKLSINPQAVDTFLTYMFIPAPISIYKEINKLEPGHYLRFKDGEIQIKQYWDFDIPKNKKPPGINETESVILDSIKLHLQSDVPMGAFVSGGVDSSLVAAVASRQLSYPLNTFTVFFTGQTNFLDDERPYVRELAGSYDFNEHELECDQNFEKIVNDILDAFDEPFGDDSVIPNYYICEHTAEKVKVALSGLGGDELFAGYRRHNGIRISGWLNRIPGPVINLIKKVVMKFPEPRDGSERIDHIKRFFRSFSTDLSESYFGYLSSIDVDKKKALYSEAMIQQISFDKTKSFVKDKFNKPSSRSAVDRALYTDIKLYMPDQILTLSDRLSMHHSLEVRVPLADKVVIEHCSHILTNKKIFLGQTKYLLKKIASRFLPESIIKHRKQGFEPPMAGWLKHELKDLLLTTLSQENIQKHGLFNFDAVNRLIHDHLNGKQKNNKILFCLLIFQLWYARFEHQFENQQ
jgi:asparagine synthase (glutamine-hydrolysing)